MDRRYYIGEVITWESQSSGTKTRKTGAIVEIVPAGRRIRNAWAYKSKLYNTRTIGSVLSIRDHESYLVAVKTGKTDKAKLSLYWPKVENIDGVK